MKGKNRGGRWARPEYASVPDAYNEPYLMSGYPQGEALQVPTITLASPKRRIGGGATLCPAWATIIRDDGNA